MAADCDRWTPGTDGKDRYRFTLETRDARATQPMENTMTNKESKEEGDKDRPIDIEDQGQEIDAAGERDHDVESVEGDDRTPGPVDEGAKEATQKAGEAPTEIIDDESETNDG